MNSNNKNIVITSAVRTAVGTFKGSLKNIQAYGLGSVVIKGAMEKSKLKMGKVSSDFLILFRGILCDILHTFYLLHGIVLLKLSYRRFLLL